jgi:osmotically-inducible protein OsmY
MQKLKMLAAAGVGFAVGYLLDPARGRSRRARLADQAASKVDKGLRRARSKLEYGRGVGQGLFYRLTKPIRPTRGIGEETLVQKVRSEALGQWRRSAQLPADVEVEVEKGTVVLGGTVSGKDDHDRLIAMVLDVDGVTLVEDHLVVLR